MCTGDRVYYAIDYSGYDMHSTSTGHYCIYVHLCYGGDLVATILPHSHHVVIVVFHLLLPDCSAVCLCT